MYTVKNHVTDTLSHSHGELMSCKCVSDVTNVRLAASNANSMNRTGSSNSVQHGGNHRVSAPLLRWRRGSGERYQQGHWLSRAVRATTSKAVGGQRDSRALKRRNGAKRSSDTHILSTHILIIKFSSGCYSKLTKVEHNLQSR